MIGIITFLGSLWGRVALGAGLILALVALRAADVTKQRKIGEVRTIEKIEKANDKATDLGKKAAAKSRAPVPSGGRVRAADIDPSTRDN